jgi:hypothetical protein
MASLKKVLGKIEIPSDGTFIVPSTVTEIEGSAFKDCKNLLAIQIPDSVANIGTEAFAGCTGLKEITIPDSVTEISWCAFYGCTNLEKVKIPDSVHTIGRRSFYGCRKLKELTIPAGVDTIGCEAFYGCSPEKINIDRRNKYFYMQDDCLLSDYGDYDSIGEKEKSKDIYLIRGCKGISTIPDGVTVIDIGALTGLDSKTISIPDSVKIIYESAFEDCTSLKSLSLPKNVGYLSSKAFKGCTSLESINIPEKIKDLDSELFHGCCSLKEIYIPDNIKSISETAFKKCTSLTKVRLPKSFEKMDNVAKIFKDCNISSIEVSQQNTHFVLENDCLLNRSKTKLILGCNKSTIPDTVKEIGDWAFSGCTDLKKIVIPDSVRKIGEGAFNNCSSLENINLPAALKEIGKEAFGSCYKLNNISISALLRKNNISFENDSFRGAPAAKGMGLWSGVDHVKRFREIMQKAAQKKAGKI